MSVLYYSSLLVVYIYIYIYIYLQLFVPRDQNRTTRLLTELMLYGHLLYFNVSKGCRFLNKHNRIFDLLMNPHC